MIPAEQRVADEYLGHGFHRVVVRHDEANFAYPIHFHNYTLVLHVVEGELTIELNHHHTTLHAGEQGMVPANALHAVRIGHDGCTYIHAEKNPG